MGRLTDRTRSRRTTGEAGVNVAPAGRAFKGSDPRGRPEKLAEAVNAELETPWRSASRYRRRAEVVDTEVVAPTGTVRLRLRVIDGDPFHFDPGQFIGIEAELPGVGCRRSPYCICPPRPLTRSSTSSSGSSTTDPSPPTSEPCSPETLSPSGVRPAAPWPLQSRLTTWCSWPPA